MLYSPTTYPEKQEFPIDMFYSIQSEARCASGLMVNELGHYFCSNEFRSLLNSHLESNFPIGSNLLVLQDVGDQSIMHELAGTS